MMVRILDHLEWRGRIMHGKKICCSKELKSVCFGKIN